MCSTREAAFRKGVAWATSYLVCAAPGPNTVIHELFGHWPMLYRTRADILNQLFMVLGGGYAWLDGAIVSKAPEDHLMDEDYLAGLDQPSLIPLGPILDDGAPRYFYPLSQRSNLQNVPDDVRSDWLQVAYEAAVMLRDRSKIEAAKNREIGAEVVRQLQDRFGDRVKTP
jgi:hypothetical protein